MANPGAGYPIFEAEDRPILFKWKKNTSLTFLGQRHLNTITMSESTKYIPMVIYALKNQRYLGKTHAASIIIFMNVTQCVLTKLENFFLMFFQ